MITITNYFIAVLHNTYIKNAGSWVDKLVEHLLATAALWVRKQTYLKM